MSEMKHDNGTWLFMDHRGDVWRLTPTGDPGMPITISREAYADPFASPERPSETREPGELWKIATELGERLAATVMEDEFDATGQHGGDYSAFFRELYT